MESGATYAWQRTSPTPVSNASRMWHGLFHQRGLILGQGDNIHRQPFVDAKIHEPVIYEIEDTKAILPSS